MVDELTKAENRVWRALINFESAHKGRPTVRDIQAVTGQSLSHISWLLDCLAQKGYVQLGPKNQRHKRPARSIQLRVRSMPIVASAQLYLTPFQTKIWRMMADYQLAYGRMPAVQDIAQYMQCSPGAVNRELAALHGKRYILLAPKNNRRHRPARGVQLLVWPMDVARVPTKYQMADSTSAQAQPPIPEHSTEAHASASKRPAWWYRTLDQALLAELDIQPRTLRIIKHAGVHTVEEAKFLLKTRPAALTTEPDVLIDLCAGIKAFEQLKAAS